MFKLFNFKSEISTKNIAFAGICGHIGTTTQAIRLMLYLKKKNKKVCYAEMNDRAFINKMHGLYPDVKYSKSSGQSVYKDLIYYRQEDYVRALATGYDFIIKDYGNFSEENFEKLSFLEQECKIIVAGSKPNEIFELAKLSDYRSYGLYYIFNFVPEDEKALIKELMKDEKDRVFFAPYTPDMFEGGACDTYFKLMLGV